MGVVKDMIVVERKLEEIFSQLPAIERPQGSFKPVFDSGDEKELISFLKSKENGSKPYPLIWMVGPYKEDHNKTTVSCENVDFILAVETTVEMSKKERLETTFDNLLIPLFNNFKKILNAANTTNITDEFSVVKMTNYGADNSNKETLTVDIWDAIKITFSFTLNNSCTRVPIKI